MESEATTGTKCPFCGEPSRTGEREDGTRWIDYTGGCGEF